jgi:hypothetical protein
VVLGWQCHFLNAEAGVVFVPFTLTMEPGAFSSFPVSMYVRVVKRGAPAPAPGPRDALAQYPFEDAAIFDRPKDGRVSRAFTAPPGAYDLYVALTERATGDLPAPRTVVLKKAVDVPDFQSTLTTSSIIVAERLGVRESRERPSFEEQLDDPYALWGMTLTPATTNTFARSQKLALLFLIYNAAAGAGDKPDVEVRYTFNRRSSGAETMFAATKPELFNAATLRPEFSLASGDLVIAGQETPLSSFPDGDYRLEIRIFDRIAGASIVRDVLFTVAGS